LIANGNEDNDIAEQGRILKARTENSKTGEEEERPGRIENGAMSKFWHRSQGEEGRAMSTNYNCPKGIENGVK
jgi:hypothetical protein